MMIAMSDSAIAVSGLRKAYEDKIVLDGIDFDVATGSVFSLLGPNGAAPGGQYTPLRTCRC